MSGVSLQTVLKFAAAQSVRQLSGYGEFTILNRRYAGKRVQKNAARQLLSKNVYRVGQKEVN